MTEEPYLNHPLMLIGSVPGESAHEVMSLWGGTLGSRLGALPDGETGYRRMWVEFLSFTVFHGNPGIETLSRPPPVDPDNPDDWRAAGDDWISLDYEHGMWTFQVRDDARDLRFETLGYAREACASYATFCDARTGSSRAEPAFRGFDSPAR